MNARLPLGLVALFGFWSVPASAAAPTKPLPPAAAGFDFNTDIKPLLEKKCLRCHGPEKQKNGFRLDSQEALAKGGDGGPVVVPGNALKSPIFTFAARAVADMEMPPDEDEALTPKELGLLRAWIERGAIFPNDVHLGAKKPPTDADRLKHWAWKAPVRPPLPQLKTPLFRSWVRNPIDAFVAVRLEKEELASSPLAARSTLLRRVYLDLIGMPPLPNEVAAFLSDTSASALDKVVDRLLASPHYGERWGRHWLDAVHYADSDGFEKDKPRSIWPYRDWVISALNQDMPYDRFVIEQLAGDLLPNATQAQRVATGFLRNSLQNEEGGADPEQFRMEALFDRVDLLGKAILGIGTGCAQCHSHKYDPISHEDYYRLMAFINNDHEPQVPFYEPDKLRLRDQILSKVSESERRLWAQNPDAQKQMAAWETRVLGDQPKWTVLSAPFNNDSTGGQKFIVQPDGAYMAQGYAPTKHSPFVVFETTATEISALRLEVLMDPNLPQGGPGRSYLGLFGLSEIVVSAAPKDAPEQKKTVKVALATSDFSEAERPLDPKFVDNTDKKRVIGPVGFASDGKDETAWGIDAGPGRRNTCRKAVFRFAEPIRFQGGARIWVTLKQVHGGWNSDDVQNNNLGRFRISITDAPNAVADPLPQSVRDALAIAPGKRSTAQRNTMWTYFRTTVAAWKADNQKIDALWKDYPEAPTTLVLMARDKPRVTSVLRRGDFLKPAKAVEPGVPSFLHPLPDPKAPRDRLALARWLVDRRSPTTARAFVNRVWQSYFGTGLVATSEDFGAQGEAPSHPELLDWLAVEFMDRGFRLKALHKLITTSAVYRQSSVVTPEVLVRDPQNRLLARGPRFRVEGEVVRDILLRSSGLLNAAVGGPSVMPPQPAFLSKAPVSYAPFPWIDDFGPNQYRRGVYVFRRRSVPFPALQTFDTPTGEAPCLRRLKSNTPTQALVTLNEPMAVQAAQALARRMLEAGPDEAARIKHGFLRVMGRSAEISEVEEFSAFLAQQRTRIQAGWLDPWLLAHGKAEPPSNLPPGVSPTDLAAMVLAARVLLNLDEAITKE